MTRDAATVEAILDRISKVAVATRSLRCLGSCALNLCRSVFSVLSLELGLLLDPQGRAPAHSASL